MSHHHIEREIKEGLRDEDGNCLHLTGYWINKSIGNFRCYTCQFQFWLRDLKRNKQHDKRRRIEVWEADR